MIEPKDTIMNANDTLGVTNSCSERLLVLLKKNGFAEESKGLCKQIQDLLNDEFSYTAIRKWLFEDSMPNSPEKRKRVAETLKIDLVYWEYGDIDRKTESTSFDDASVNLHHHVAVIEELKEHGVGIGESISEEGVLKIIGTSVYVGKSHGVAKPDKRLISKLIDIAQPEKK